MSRETFIFDFPKATFYDISGYLIVGMYAEHPKFFVQMMISQYSRKVKTIYFLLATFPNSRLILAFAIV